MIVVLVQEKTREESPVLGVAFDHWTVACAQLKRDAVPKVRLQFLKVNLVTIIGVPWLVLDQSQALIEEVSKVIEKYVLKGINRDYKHQNHIHYALGYYIPFL